MVTGENLEPHVSAPHASSRLDVAHAIFRPGILNKTSVWLLTVCKGVHARKSVTHDLRLTNFWGHTAGTVETEPP